MAGSSTQNQVPKLYMSVVDDVISNIRETFLDDGVDESTLEELKTLWLSKLKTSKALEPPPPPKHDDLYIQKIQQQQQKLLSQSRAQAPQPVGAVQQHRQPGIQQIHPVHLPIQLAQHRDLTNPAAAATMALPAGLFQQQLLSQGLTLQPTSTGQLIAVRTMPTGTSIQGPDGQHIQILTQPAMGAAQIHLAQSKLDGGRISQLDGANDLVTDPSTPDLDLVTSADQSHYRLQSPDRAVCKECTATLSTNENSATSHDKTCTHITKPPNLPRTRTRRSKKSREVIVEFNCTSDTTQTWSHSSRACDVIVQLDGAGDTSSEEEEDEEVNEGDTEEAEGVVEDPLNSDDDISEADPSELFDTENVVVCQYDKINRNKNRWKFQLKDGIMNLNGRDYVFQRANGDAEW